MRSLRTQLSVAIMSIVLFTVSVISLSSNLLINQEFEKYMAEQQKAKADSFVLNFNSQYNRLTQEWNIEYIHGAGMYAMFDGYIIKVYGKNGEIIWDAENHDMALCSQIMTDISARMEKRRPDITGGFTTYDYELSVSGQKIGSMQISYYGPYFLSESDFNFLDTINIVLIIIGILSILMSLIIGGVFARRITRPIAKTAYIAKQISEGNYATRFDGKTKSKELDELTDTINRLADGLLEQENLRKRLTVDVAHELRTPLTTLSSHLEAMIEGVWEPSVPRLKSCHEEIGRLSGLVADLERLAKTESDNLVLVKTKVDLLEIVRLGGDNFEAEIKKKNLSLTIEGVSTWVQVDADRINQVVTNLLSNAVKYTHENGHIRIVVKDACDYGIFIIEDDGIGIPEHELPLVFERFYRTDKSRNRKTGGVGIGLAIVKSIVAAHGGSVAAESRAEGGSRFIVTLSKK